MRLTDLAFLDTAEDRALAAAAQAAAWFRSDPMTRLLLIAGAQPPNLIDGLSTLDSSESRWLHLGEELPVWITPLLEAPAGGFDCTRFGDLVGATLDCLDLEQVCADAFNFRSRDGVTYRERSQAVVGNFSDQDRSAIRSEAALLGLVNATTPALCAYDVMVVLGGGYRSPLIRAEYAAELLAKGVRADIWAFLGSPRRMISEPPESPQVQDYAPNAVDEFDLMRGAAHRAFGVGLGPTAMICGCKNDAELCPRWLSQMCPEKSVRDATPPEFTHRRWCELHFDGGEVAGYVLSAHTGRPPYRPDTSDTFALLQETIELAHRRALVVTTQVFVPFQSFDALRRMYIPLGVSVDVVGFDAARGDRPETAEYLLQEVLSAVRSARRLMIFACEVVGVPLFLDRLDADRA